MANWFEWEDARTTNLHPSCDGAPVVFDVIGGVVSVSDGGSLLWYTTTEATAAADEYADYQEWCDAFEARGWPIWSAEGGVPTRGGAEFLDAAKAAWDTLQNEALTCESCGKPFQADADWIVCPACRTPEAN